jgi:predicted O-methyltransferase YrrM
MEGNGMTKFVVDDVPWLVPDSILFLEKILHKQCMVIETGSGGSTVWLAQRVNRVITFEHKKAWVDATQNRLNELKLTNVQFFLDPDYPTKGIGHQSAYLYDLALIDGRGRVKSIRTILPKIKPGGYICLDNSDRPKYQPAIKMLDKTCVSKSTFKERWETSFWKI